MIQGIACFRRRGGARCVPFAVSARRCGGCEKVLDSEELFAPLWDKWLGFHFCSPACALIDGWIGGDRL